MDAALGSLKETAKDPSKNAMPDIIRAVESYATIGEIRQTLISVFGEYQGQFL